jgi:hypothetical protein
MSGVSALKRRNVGLKGPVNPVSLETASQYVPSLEAFETKKLQSLIAGCGAPVLVVSRQFGRTTFNQLQER